VIAYLDIVLFDELLNGVDRLVGFRIEDAQPIVLAKSNTFRAPFSSSGIPTTP
jgi:hypothetical protein